MPFYENTIVVKQDLTAKDLNTIKNKYDDLIKKSSGKVLRVEEWGLLSLAAKIKKYSKAFYIHYKFEGNNDTLNEIKKKIKVDKDILRYLIVKYKSLDLNNQFFKKEKTQ